jgi:DNA polymerase-3 subunit gamma/tau
MTLYLKYRPQTIDELDLEGVRREITRIAGDLANAPHAFLFSGPRGTGKTSAARILAKILNCENPKVTKNGVEPCNKCSQCRAITNGQSMDVVEIDTASNRGIDDIRTLRENISLSPVSAKKKVYIMDEAHMLTIEAANAFLKTLEEPPTHAVFILATTDPMKLPETVRSRLTLVQFQKANASEIKRQLKRVITGEKLDVEDGVVDLIAKKADGSFRDAVKILENLALGRGKIGKSRADEYLFSVNLVSSRDLLDLILKRDLNSFLSQLKSFCSSGGYIKDLVDMVEEKLREKILSDPKPDLVRLAKLLMEARANLSRTSIPELPLELAVIEWCNEGKPVNLETSEPGNEDKKKAVEVKPQVEDEAKAPAKVPVGDIDEGIWAKILEATKSKNVSLEALLRSSRPAGIDGNTFNLAVYYQFHKERLEVEQYRSLIEGVIADVTGVVNPRIKCYLEEPPKEALKSAHDPDILNAAKEIFGE